MTQDLEKTLWATADKLRNNMDTAEYKQIVLDLIFPKNSSDSFEELLHNLKSDYLTKPEDKGMTRSGNNK
jgi:type I restriction enzyme M protein